MSIAASHWAIRQDLPALQKLVLIALADRHNSDTDRCDPSISLVCEDCGMSRNAVRDAIRGLREKGYVEAIERFDGPAQMSNFYTLHLEFDNPTPGRKKTPYPGRKVTPSGLPDDPAPGSPEGHKPVITKPVKEPNTKSSFVLPPWIDSQSWKDYEEMRRRIGKPMTDRARTLAVNELAKLEAKGQRHTDVLDQSVMNSWQGLFELRQQNGARGNGAVPRSKTAGNLEVLKRSLAGTKHPGSSNENGLFQTGGDRRSDAGALQLGAEGSRPSGVSSGNGGTG